MLGTSNSDGVALKWPQAVKDFIRPELQYSQQIAQLTEDTITATTNSRLCDKKAAILKKKNSHQLMCFIGNLEEREIILDALWTKQSDKNPSEKQKLIQK